MNNEYYDKYPFICISILLYPTPEALRKNSILMNLMRLIRLMTIKMMISASKLEPYSMDDEGDFFSKNYQCEPGVK